MRLIFGPLTYSDIYCCIFVEHSLKSQVVKLNFSTESHTVFQKKVPKAGKCSNNIYNENSQGTESQMYLTSNV